MASPATRFVLALLTFVTIGMIIGALLQLAYIRRLEESYGTESSLRRLSEIRNRGGVQLTRGISYWEDKEALILRLGYVKPEIISWSPRIVVFHNFLSTEECDYLRELAKPRLQVSTVVDTRTGKGIKSNVRTSSGMFLSNEERKYSLIQFNLKRGGQRVATMLMYLSDNVEGGETFFPQAGSGECSCGGKMVKGLCVKPNKGDAVLFWSMGLDGQSDPNSIHGGCEVLSGEKWSATKWMRQKTAT